MRIWHNNTDISNLVSSLTWSGSRLQAARRLEFDYVQDDRDPNVPQIVINNGETVYGYDDAGKLVFRGNVFDVEKDRRQSRVHIVAFDNLFIFNCRIDKHCHKSSGKEEEHNNIDLQNRHPFR